MLALGVGAPRPLSQWGSGGVWGPCPRVTRDLLLPFIFVLPPPFLRAGRLALPPRSLPLCPPSARLAIQGVALQCFWLRGSESWTIVTEPPGAGRRTQPPGAGPRGSSSPPGGTQPPGAGFAGPDQPSRRDSASGRGAAGGRAASPAGLRPEASFHALHGETGAAVPCHRRDACCPFTTPRVLSRGKKGGACWRWAVAPHGPSPSGGRVGCGAVSPFHACTSFSPLFFSSLPTSSARVDPHSRPGPSPSVRRARGRRFMGVGVPRFRLGGSESWTVGTEPPGGGRGGRQAVPAGHRSGRGAAGSTSRPGRTRPMGPAQRGSTCRPGVTQVRGVPLPRRPPRPGPGSRAVATLLAATSRRLAGWEGGDGGAFWRLAAEPCGPLTQGPLGVGPVSRVHACTFLPLFFSLPPSSPRIDQHYRPDPSRLVRRARGNKDTDQEGRPAGPAGFRLSARAAGFEQPAPRDSASGRGVAGLDLQARRDS